MDRVVKPVHGLVAVRPARWDRVDADGVRLIVHFTSEPVWEVARVDVAEAADSIDVTLYVGVAASSGPVVAPQVAEQRVVEASLSSPIGTRRVVDGAEGRRSAP